MIQWVVEAAKRAKSLSDVYVATDDERIVRAVESFGGKAVMTDSNLQSGTDRVAAVADLYSADIYINIQGDEPLMDTRAVDAAVELIQSGRFQMSTVMTPLTTEAELHDISVVKVLADKNQRSIYFSRYPIPYSRILKPAPGEPFICRRHVGLYGYTREVLFRIRSLAPSKIELGESLEQLRAIEDGIQIGITEVDFLSIGVDTPKDLETVREYIRTHRQGSK